MTEGDAAPAASFLALLDLHRGLKELFLRHQEALLASDLEQARRLLLEFEATLYHHIQVEEEILLPVYAERAGRVPGGPPELFLGEHRNLKTFVAEFKERLGEMRPGAPGLRRQTITLFDREAVFKQVVEHHDLREQNLLYPHLDRVTTPEERAALLARCTTDPAPSASPEVRWGEQRSGGSSSG